ncbi:MAG: hypothetical protein DYH02_15705 [Candidatus Omnitrophica bacterium COP1]|nr:hypothetical protein [Candidatus Omnitrophica bacterium COP1]
MYRQLFSVVVFFLFIGQPCMGEASLRVGPYLQNFTPNSIVIMWETDKPCEGWVEYGSSTALGQKAEGVATCTHEIEIKGLEPATRYYYKVVFQDRTPDRPSKFSFCGLWRFTLRLCDSFKNRPADHRNGSGFCD